MNNKNRIENMLTEFPESMRVPETVYIGTGTAVYFSARSPDKETPNEDALAMISIDDITSVLIVADGLGGQPAGEEASRIVINCLLETLELISGDTARIREAILDGIEQANNELLESGNGSATTVVVAEIQGKMVRTYHAGDSMILLVGNKGRVKYSIIPHSPTGYALEAGFIDESEAMLHEERHFISNFIGSPEMRLEIGPQIEMSSRDTLILASDGLSDNLYEDEIVELSRKGPLKKCARNLIASASKYMLEEATDRQQHPDDLTFILYRPGAVSG